MSSAPFADAFGDLGAALDSAGDSVILLPLSRVFEDPDNPRTSFDDAELDALAATLRDHGVLQPVVVRPADGDGRHMIRFGARRFREAKRAGLTEVRAIIQPDSSDEVGRLVQQLIENEQREGLNTADLARAVDRLLALKLKQGEIAKRLGRPREQIVMLASVREMPPELKVLAAELGLRTLYELHGAWKADAERALGWLRGRDPKTITQAAARELAGRPVAPRRMVRDPSDGSVHVAPGGRAIETGPPAASVAAGVAVSPAAAPAGVIGAAVFEVRAGRLKGELILDNVLAPRSDVLVRLKDGSVQAVAAGALRIVKVRPG